MKDIAMKLIKERINGTRKGLSEPNYTHSIRVYNRLVHAGYDEDTCLAGLLHDVIEDSDVIFNDLEVLGFNKDVINMVWYCTHVESIKNKDLRWAKMIVDIMEDKEYGAAAIKAYDLIDNLSQCEYLSDDRQYAMKSVKAPLMVAIGKGILKDEAIEEIKQSAKL